VPSEGRSRPPTTPAAGSSAGSRVERPTEEIVPEPTGVLRVSAIPWADVTVDGRRLDAGPIGTISLEPGKHVVRFEHPDYQTVQRKVTIRAGETVELIVDLPEEALPKEP
jgi:hypothetical protein